MLAGWSECNLGLQTSPFMRSRGSCITVHARLRIFHMKY
jgi:hypothetical protein